jgi:hypothetical protein
LGSFAQRTAQRACARPWEKRPNRMYVVSVPRPFRLSASGRNKIHPSVHAMAELFKAVKTPLRPHDHDIVPLAQAIPISHQHSRCRTAIQSSRELRVGCPLPILKLRASHRVTPGTFSCEMNFSRSQFPSMPRSTDHYVSASLMRGMVSGAVRSCALRRSHGSHGR